MVSYEAVLLLIIIWNIFILAGTTYLVFWKGISPLWFILSVLLLQHPDNELFFDCQNKLSK